MTVEAETAVTWLQAKEYLAPPESGRSKEEASPGAPRRNQSCRYTDFGLPEQGE